MISLTHAVANQVFIPRRTIDLQRSVEKATEALSRERDEGGLLGGRGGEPPSAASIAKRLGITERAVLGVHQLWHTKLLSLEPGGAKNDNPYEDVQMAKQMDKINSAELDVSGNSSG
jgi:DNA-directed RNA polymerase specialized sigma subunit